MITSAIPIYILTITTTHILPSRRNRCSYFLLAASHCSTPPCNPGYLFSPPGCHGLQSTLLFYGTRKSTTVTPAREYPTTIHHYLNHEHLHSHWSKPFLLLVLMSLGMQSHNNERIILHLILQPQRNVKYTRNVQRTCGVFQSLGTIANTSSTQAIFTTKTKQISTNIISCISSKCKAPPSLGCGRFISLYQIRSILPNPQLSYQLRFSPCFGIHPLKFMPNFSHELLRPKPVYGITWLNPVPGESHSP